MTAPAVEQRRRGRGGARPADAAPSRLPAPTRDRRPALAALAVLLIVGGALASGLVALRSGQRVDYLVAAREIAPGAQVAAADLRVARIAGTGASAIPASRRGEVVGTYATTRIPANALLTGAMVSREQRVPSGAAVVGVVLSATQQPAAPLREGDVVRVFTVPREEEGGGAATVLVDAAEVVEVGGDTRGEQSGTAVSLLVREGVAQEVTLQAALRKISVVRLAPGVEPAVSSNGG